MSFWDEANECMDGKEIRQIQLERLQATLHRVFKNVRHYRKSFMDIDFFPEDFKDLSDLARLPFTTRKDLMENYPYGMFAVPLREVVRLHTPVWNYETPVVMGFTRKDLESWADLMARNLTAVGVDRDDVVQISLSSGIITGTFGAQLGAERIGASVIPISNADFAAQLRIMKDFRTTTLVSTPTCGLGLARTITAQGLDSNSLSLKYGIFGSEPWSESTRTELENRLHLSATDTYGLTEVFGPGVAWECPEKNGLHLAEDHFIAEIVDPETLVPLSPGEQGELVLTTISKEAYPLIRFRTGDITRIDPEPCPCGRTHCRISRIFKRSDDLFVMRGACIMPDQIGRILSEAIGIDPDYHLVVERMEDQDHLTVLLAVSDGLFFDEMKKQRRLVEDIQRAVSRFLGWDVKVRLVEPDAVDSRVKLTDKRSYT